MVSNKCLKLLPVWKKSERKEGHRKDKRKEGKKEGRRKGGRKDNNKDGRNVEGKDSLKEGKQSRQSMGFYALKTNKPSVFPKELGGVLHITLG